MPGDSNTPEFDEGVSLPPLPNAEASKPSTATNVTRGLSVLFATLGSTPELAPMLMRQFQEQDAAKQAAGQQQFQNRLALSREQSRREAATRSEKQREEDVRFREKGAKLQRERFEAQQTSEGVSQRQAEERLQLSKQAGARAQRGQDLEQAQVTADQTARALSQVQRGMEQIAQTGGARAGNRVFSQLFKTNLDLRTKLMTAQTPEARNAVFDEAMATVNMQDILKQTGEKVDDPEALKSGIIKIAQTATLGITDPAARQQFLDSMDLLPTPAETVALKADLGGEINEADIQAVQQELVPSLTTALRDGVMSPEDMHTFARVFEGMTPGRINLNGEVIADPGEAMDVVVQAIDQSFEATVPALMLEGFLEEDIRAQQEAIIQGLMEAAETGNVARFESAVIAKSKDPDVAAIAKSRQRTMEAILANQADESLNAFEKAKRDKELRAKLAEPIAPAAEKRKAKRKKRQATVIGAFSKIRRQ